MNRAERRQAARDAVKAAASTQDLIDDAARARDAQSQRIEAARARADRARTDPDAWAQAWAADGDAGQLNIWARRLAYDILDTDDNAALDRWTASTTDPILLARTAAAALVLVKEAVVDLLVATLEASTATQLPAADGFEPRAAFAENAAQAWEQSP